MNTIIENLDKANALLGTLMEDYGVHDAQEPTDSEKIKYELDCGRIHSFISLAADCVSAANKGLRKGGCR